MRLFALLLTCIIACFSSDAYAQKKVALVIGNGKYVAENELKGPFNDAKLIGGALRAAGFSMVGGTEQIDLTKQQMDGAVRQLGRSANGADIALFYFSGHGAQIDGTNYLIPTDEDSNSKAEFVSETVSMDAVMYQLAESNAKLKIVILDACRNNPFVRRNKKGNDGGGLAQMRAPEGTLIAFATQPGNTARDGYPNSPYTRALGEFIKRPGMDIFALFNDVGIAVVDSTDGEQQPWVSMSPIRGRFYFTQPIVVANVSPAIVPQVAMPVQIDASPVVTGQSISLVQRAYQEMGQGRINDARATLNDAIARDSKSAVPYSYLGYSWYLEGNQLRRQLWPTGRGRLDEPVARMILEKYRNSTAQLDIAINNDQQYYLARMHRGNVIHAAYQVRQAANLVLNDILDVAIKDLTIAVQLAPSEPRPLRSLADAYVTKKMYAQAIKQYDAVLQMNPKYASAYDGRCRAYALMGNWSAAQSDADSARRIADEYNAKSCLQIQ